MEVSFNANQVPAEQVSPEKPAVTQTPQPAGAPTPTPPPTAVATIPSGAVTTGGPILGDFIPEFKDIILPRLNITQNIGELNKISPPGSILYNQTLPLFVPPLVDPKTNEIKRAATPPLTLVVLGFRPTRYCEKVEGGVRGMIVDTEDAVRANGGTLDYNEWKLKKASGIKRFEPLADAFVAIERPEAVKDDNTIFIYEVGGKKYALALWGMRGTAYTEGAKRVFFTSRAFGCLSKGYWTWSYAVSSIEKQYQGGNRAWIPVCIPKELTTPEFHTFVQKVLNAPTAANS